MRRLKMSHVVVFLNPFHYISKLCTHSFHTFNARGPFLNPSEFILPPNHSFNDYFKKKLEILGIEGLGATTTGI